MKRLIARLDVKNNKLIKSISFEGLRVIGEINNFAKKYYKWRYDKWRFDKWRHNKWRYNKWGDMIS